MFVAWWVQDIDRMNPEVMVTRLLDVFDGYHILKRLLVDGKVDADICITDLDGNGVREIMTNYDSILDKCFGKAPSVAPGPLSQIQRMRLTPSATILRKRQKCRVGVGNLFAYLSTSFRLASISRVDGDDTEMSSATTNEYVQIMRDARKSDAVNGFDFDDDDDATMTQLSQAEIDAETAAQRVVAAEMEDDMFESDAEEEMGVEEGEEEDEGGEEGGGGEDDAELRACDWPEGAPFMFMVLRV